MAIGYSSIEAYQPISMNGNNISMGQGSLYSVGSIGGGSSALVLNSNMNVGGQTLTGGLAFSGGLSGSGSVTFNTLSGSGSRSVNANANGVLSAGSSSLRYKENVESLRNSERLLDVDTIVWQYKDRDFYGDRLYAGFAAEAMHDAGLSIFVDYDDQGRPDNVRKEDLAAPILELIKNLYKKIGELESRIKELD